MQVFSFTYWTGHDPEDPDGDDDESEDDPDHFDPEYYAQAIVRAAQYESPDPKEGEWRFLALVIQPDGLYLREFDGDAVEELGKAEVDIPNGQWHTVTIELGGEDGNHVVVKQLLNGAEKAERIEGETSIPGGGRVGFGVGSDANFRFDNVGTRQDVTLTETAALRYHYDASGRVVGRTLNPGEEDEESQFFIYDGDRIIQELDGSGNLVAAWDYGVYIDEILAMHRDTNNDGTLDTYYYLQDDLYNVVGLVDASGNVVERYAYSDYGSPTIYSGDGATTRTESAYGNPFLFQGHRWDEVLSLYDYRTRYYDPAIGRFLRIDTIGLWGDSNNLGNPYAFVGNNPWSRVDPYGEQRFDEFMSDLENGNLNGALPGDISKRSIEDNAAGSKGARDLHVASETMNAVVEFTADDYENMESLGSFLPFVGVGVDIDLGRRDFKRGYYISSALNFIGIIPVAGDALQAGKKIVEEGADGLKAASKAKILRNNKAIGAAAEILAESDLIAEGFTILGRQVHVKTPHGVRKVDLLVKSPDGKVIGVEVKSGNATRSADQVKKDLEIETNGGTLKGKNAPDDLLGVKGTKFTTIERRISRERVEEALRNK